MRGLYKTYIKTFCLALLFAGLTIVLSSQGASADGEKEVNRRTPTGDKYKLKVGSEYSYSESNRVDEFPFGEGYAGKFYVEGSDIREEKHSNYEAYGTEGTLTFGYEYNNRLKNSASGKWSIEDDGQKVVKGVKLSKDVDSGAIIIEKSYDTNSWSVVETRRDFFDNHPNGESKLYTTDYEDVKHGVYYRVTVAYRVEQSKGIFQSNPRAECVEVYTFYVGEYRSSLHLCEVFSGEDISGSAEITTETTKGTTTQYGFSVMCDSAESKIYVKGPNNSSDYAVPQYMVFTQAGDYSIKLYTALNYKYEYLVKVKEGVDTVELSPKAYKTNDSYNNSKDAENSIGDRNMTSLFVEQTKGYTINQTTKDKVQAITVNGESVTLYLQLNYGKEISPGLQLTNDSFGGSEGQRVYGAETGKIDSGALIIQTSKDGKDWECIDKGRYKDGLYTTDFQNQYGSGRRIPIYTPSGQEVLEGLYIRVAYAYEVKQKSGTQNYIEEYTFYLCNSNVKAVVFHNLSAEDTIREVLSTEDQITADIYKRAETLKDYTQTLTGFRVDTSLNPTVTYTVKKDGVPQSPWLSTFTETGKYEITLKSLTESDYLTIFVDRTSSTTSLKEYFGEGFLQGKRIYAETGYPVYVAGKTSYKIQDRSNQMLVIGEIRNLTTQKVIKIDRDKPNRAGILDEHGEYEAVLYTNGTFESDSPVGDTRVFTFHFILIDEKDNPGPVVNERSLNEYAKTNISDLCPRYYGITYPSAGKGTITCAFATWQDAYDYAYEHEKGMVERQEDGSYRYFGECQVAQKEKYESTWVLTDALNYFATQAIHEYFFDMSDEFSYITLPQEVLDNEENLRKLELSNSVIVFGPGQKEKLLAEEGLPIISPKKYATLEPGLDSPIIRGDNDFEFVRDENGYDSDSVVIVDKNNHTCHIDYRMGVGSKLQDLGCSSGIVKISEANIYKDSNEYDAVFIREGENLASVTIQARYGEQIERIVVDANSEREPFIVNEFKPLQIQDETDRYSYLKISHGNEVSSMLAESLGDVKFSEPGEYNIRCINRLGYYFDFSIIVREGSLATLIQCTDGDGTVQEIETREGSTDVKLYGFTRTGYELIGYTDGKGKHYPTVIPQVTFSGCITLQAEWQPKDCLVKVVNQSAETIAEIKATYDETIDITKQCEAAGLKISGLSVDGEEVKNGMLTVQKEGEIIVVATVVAGDGKSGGYKTVLIVFLALATVGIVVGGVVYYKKRRTHNEKTQ